MASNRVTFFFYYDRNGTFTISPSLEEVTWLLTDYAEDSLELLRAFRSLSQEVDHFVRGWHTYSRAGFVRMNALHFAYSGSQSFVLNFCSGIRRLLPHLNAAEAVVLRDGIENTISFLRIIHPDE